MPVTFPNRPPGGWMSVPKEELPKHGGWLNTRVSLTERWNAMYMQEDPNVGGPLHAYHQYAASVRPVDASNNQEYVSPAPPAYKEENVASARPVYNYNEQEDAASAHPVPSAQPIYNTQEYVASTHQVDTYNKQEYVAPARPTYKQYVASARPIYKQEYTASAHPVDAYKKQEYVSSARPVYNTQEHVASARPVHAYNNQEYLASIQTYNNQGYEGYVAPVRRNKTRLLKEYPPYIKRWLADASPSIPSSTSSEVVEKQHVEEQHFEEQRVQEQQYEEEQRAEEQQYAEEQRVEEKRVEEKRVAEERVSEKRVHEERVEEQQVKEQQYVEEERDDTELSGWDINEEFTESNLTTSPRLKIRHMQDDAQRDILRQLSRVLSQSPAPKPVITEENELPESPEKEITLKESEIQNPAPIQEPTSVPTSVPILDPITPAIIIPTPHAKDMTLEDSTLDAFESVLEHPVTIPTTFEQYFAMEVAERERLIDEAVRARMNNRLDHTKHGIRDARKGIGRLDDFISSIPSAPIMPAAPAISEAPKVTVVTAASNTIDESTSNNTVIELNLKIRRPEWCQFWIMNPEPQTRGRFANFGASRNWKFTWLGLILAIFSAWYLAESAMCGIYCHPTTSSTNTWQPSDPFFPYAIPTKLDQWTGKVVSGTAHVIKIRVADFLDPEGARFEIHPRNAHMGARDWWQGRSGPIGYRPYKDMDISIESDDETF
ncbi:hypothetical protein DL95DRAFT_391391 [Leptodontidium sp. 2 PMI_412]|nr:hypothetical protein DL95DRAFT_391391 [Leptodontidium sp. 2 PMI_412]